MLIDITLFFHELLNWVVKNDPMLIVGLGIMGCCFLILAIASIPWQWYRQEEFKLLEKKIDLLVDEYKIEVTQALQRRH